MRFVRRMTLSAAPDLKTEPIRSSAARTLAQRALTLQRTIGNAAVARVVESGDRGARLARAPADAPWAFDPAPKPIDLYPWNSPDPAVRARWNQQLEWSLRAPKNVRIDVTAKGLASARATAVTAPPAPTAPAPATSNDPTASPSGPSVTMTPGPEKGVQVQVSWTDVAEAHTKPSGPGAGPDAHATTDTQGQLQASVTIVYHDDDKPGWEWATQVQLNWSSAATLAAAKGQLIQLSSVQIGDQLAYVIPLWKAAQLQIFGQIMFGEGLDRSTQAQVSGGGQIQLKVSEHVQLFLQAGVGGTETSGAGHSPAVTGDASIGVGVIYQF
jgi:hypothetical protein